ncbi:LysR family transcriptional regulator [Actinoplanes sp. NPDC026670]|uniref:LysR family transcriptional regulator n=1 Tax=Actinoplanes sp. NPDC026670 TaxID=3154700 RepID=UPI0033FE34E7
MLLRELEYLAALARERHFARAAAACHVSQPSLSAAIRRLEHDLGVPIVQRGRRFAGLTPEGERVLRWAHRILADAEALRQDLSAMRDGLTGTLRLGAIPTALTAASLLTTPLCAGHPRVRVSLESVSSPQVARLLSEFEMDVALTYLEDETLTGMRTIPLYEERYLLLTPDDGTYADRDAVTWAEVATLPLCLLSPRMRNRRILDELFAAEGAVPVPAVETDTVGALYAHIATHQWSTVIAHAWLQTFGVPDGMRIIPMRGQPRRPRIGLVLAERDFEPALIRALLDVAGRVDLRGQLDTLVKRHLQRR